MEKYVVILMQPMERTESGWFAVPFGPYDTIQEAIEIRDSGRITLHGGDYLKIAHLRTLGD